MKKIFTLVAATAFALTASAQTWDFTVIPTQICDGTGNLRSSVGDHINDDGGESWSAFYNAGGIKDEEQFTVKAGELFEQTKGLSFGILDNDKMVLYRNYPTAYGGCHLYFNKDVDVTIPAKAGQIIEFVACSGKNDKAVSSMGIEEGFTILYSKEFEYSTYSCKATEDNPVLTIKSAVYVQKITVKNDAGATNGALFSWEGGEGGATVTGGTATYKSGPEGTDRVNYANAGYYTLSINGKKANMGTEESNNGGYIQIDLDQELKADDAINLTGYLNKPDETKEASIFFQFEKGEGVDDPYVFGDADNITNGGAITTHEFKVPADAEGSKNFKMTRSKAQTNIFLTKLTITRGTSGISEIKAVRMADNAIYNLAGQKVGKDYKGIVIMNGKKYLAK